MDRKKIKILAHTKLYLFCSEDIVQNNVGARKMLLNLKNGEYYVINDAGYVIWQKANKTADIDKVAKEISSIYGIAERRALREVLNFAKKLSSFRLIKTRCGPAERNLKRRIGKLGHGTKKNRQKPNIIRVGNLKDDCISGKYRHLFINE